MTSLSNDIKITTTKTAKISGTRELLAVQLKEFVDSIPPSAKIDIKQSNRIQYPGEYGVDPWSLTATWNE